MPVTNLDELALALKRGLRGPFNKNSITVTAGGTGFFWSTIGYPVAGSIPVAAAVCNNLLLGAMPLAARTGLEERLLALVAYSAQTLGTGLEIEDRLAHMGGLNGTLTTVQTVGVDCSLTTSNLVERIGAADYSDIEWGLDVYTATGATIATPTFAVTFNDNSTGVAGIINAPSGTVTLPASAQTNRRFQIQGSKPIKSIQSMTLSASTGTAGNLGVTAVRKLALIESILANKTEVYDYAKLGLPKIFDQSCLTFSCLIQGSSSGFITGSVRQAVN